ncbi:endonuclease III domain-containing protein [Dethiosulfatarculus sandiegensis]|uniref:Endonuclease n=1 Tax=Dethiosulfatarculus sandiegensis TaxID=1429043 RepID=A0A0D2HL45_9BACT|nr:endonuclease [Dethiosulfatarculus sandiegensis]KIX11358.1 endonuclease [Dethiosulfatarculus sandiegensis]
MEIKEILEELYDLPFKRFGDLHWWPGETRFEIMVGAILTQNTNWQNVEKAITNLKKARVLSLDRLLQLPPEELSRLIRPAGYYNLKEKRLRNLLNLVQQDAGGDLDAFFKGPLKEVREKLLSSKGVGPETADSILLYAGGRPTFVVDAYTMRILSRHHLIPAKAAYEEVRLLFMKNLPNKAPFFNQYHAQLVMIGKDYCKKSKPACEDCPLDSWQRS